MKIVKSELSPQLQAAAWLDGMIAQAAALPAGETLPVAVELTPALAEVLTEPERNPNNRRVSDYIVARYARDIGWRRWKANGQSIVISREGLLNDGQHRCWAVIEARASIRVVMVFGAERASRDTLDQGKVRTVADVLVMEDTAEGGDARYLGAIATFLLTYRTYGGITPPKIAQRPTRAQIIECVEGTPELSRHLRAIPSFNIVALGGRPFLAFCHYIIAERAGFARTREFFEPLLTGAGLAADSPILRVRERLRADSGRLKPNEKLELVLRTWNAWRRGANANHVLITQNNNVPEIDR